jgi:hypothetical protein
MKEYGGLGLHERDWGLRFKEKGLSQGGFKPRECNNIFYVAQRPIPPPKTHVLIVLAFWGLGTLRKLTQIVGDSIGDWRTC